jgi:hypothetical protein
MPSGGSVPPGFRLAEVSDEHPTYGEIGRLPPVTPENVVKTAFTFERMLQTITVKMF